MADYNYQIVLAGLGPVDQFDEEDQEELIHTELPRKIFRKYWMILYVFYLP